MGLGSRLAGTPYDQLTYQQRLMSAGDRARALAEGGGVLGAMAGGGEGSESDEESSIMGMLSGEGQQQEPAENRGGFTQGQSYAGANDYRQRMEDEKRQRMAANRPGLEDREQRRSDDYYRGTYGVTPDQVSGGGYGGNGGVLGMLGGRYPVVNAPGLPRRGYGGQQGLSFEERLALQNAGFQGRRELTEMEQGALGQRAAAGNQLRGQLHAAPTGTAQLGAQVRTAELAQDDEHFKATQAANAKKLAAVMDRVRSADLMEATTELAAMQAKIAKKQEEVKARKGKGYFSPDDEVKGQAMPGYTAGEESSLPYMTQIAEALKQRVAQLQGASPQVP